MLHIVPLVRYLVSRAILLGGEMIFYGFLGFVLGGTTSSFITVLAVFMGLYILVIGAVTVKTLIRDDKKYFQSQSEDKIRFHLFLRRSVYIFSLIDFLIVITVVGGIVDSYPVLKRFLEAIVLALFVLIVLGIGTLIDESVSKFTNYSLSMASFKLSMNSNIDSQNFYFLLALRYYDKFLRRRFGLSLFNLEGIFNRFILTDEQRRNEVIESFLSSESNTLAPIIATNKILNYDSENILMKYSNADRIKEGITFVIPVLAILVSFIQLLVMRR
jgi:uncharacterized membrane protein (Fun14 family)